MLSQILKVIVVLMIIQFMSGQGPQQVAVYDSQGNGTMWDRNYDQFSFFIKRSVSSTSYPTDSFQYDATGTGKPKTITYSSTSQLQRKTLTKKATCSLLQDSSVTNQTVYVVRFDDKDNDLVENLVTSTFSLDKTKISNSKFAAAHLCKAIAVNGTVYHLNSSITTAGATKYPTPDTSPTWTNPYFSDDFTYVVDDAGLYLYATATKTYASVLSTTFYKQKQIWTTSKAIVVHSYAYTTGSIYNYSFQAFSIPSSGTNYTLVGKIQGTYYDSSGGDEPMEISLSETLSTLVLYGKANATTYFALGKIFDYTSLTVVDLNIPAWVTTTKSAVSVSDMYIYAYNTADIAGQSGVRNHSFSLLKSPNFTPQTMDPTWNTNLRRIKIVEKSNGETNLVLTKINYTQTIISLEEVQMTSQYTHTPFYWGKKGVQGTFTIAESGTAFYEKPGAAAWFQQVIKPSKETQFYSVRTDPSTLTSLVSKYNATSNYSLKAASSNYLCALIYETATPSLKVVSFANDSASQIWVVPTIFYDKFDLTAANNTFEVSDDCKAVRMNTVIAHYDADKRTSTKDTYPNGTTELANSVFNDDFSLAVADTGIYSYTDGVYNLARADTFDVNKKVFNIGSNLLIFTYVPTNNTQYSWNVQLNTIQNGSPTIFTQFNGIVQANPPSILVSPKLTKIIVQGTSPTDPTKSVFVGAHVDWTNKNAPSMTLPINTTGLTTQIAVSDDYLYVNYVGTDKTHVAYVFVGSSCIQIMNEAFPFPTATYKRTILLQNQTQYKQLVLGHQYETDNNVKILTDSRDKYSNYINPNPASVYEYNLTSTDETIDIKSGDSFGKYLELTTAPALNYYEYDPNATNKLKKITNTEVPADGGFTAQSTDFSCVIVSNSNNNSTKAIAINSSSSTATTLTGWTSLVGSADLPQTDFDDASNGGTIAVGPFCWAIKVGSLVFFKNTDGSVLTKSLASANFTLPVFDKSLTFVHDNGVIYKYNGTDYVQAFTVTGLLKIVKLYPSSDKSRLTILSNNINPDTRIYNVVIKMYIYSNNSWQSVQLPNKMASFVSFNLPQLTFTPSFDSFGIQYFQKKGQQSFIPLMDLYTLDLGTNIISSISVPSKFNVVNSIFGGYIYGRFVYFNQQIDKGANQYIYLIDRSTKQLVQIDYRKISTVENQLLNTQDVHQQSGSITVRYQYKIDSSIVMKIRPIGTPAQRTLAKVINSKDTSLVFKDNQIYPCPPGCSYCVDPKRCETCLQGFNLDENGVCAKCGPTCADCTGNDLLTCTACADGAFLNSTSYLCVECKSNCLTCDGDAATCTSCKNGFYLSDGSCQSCIDNCLSCHDPVSSTDSLCDECIPGYVYNTETQICVKCTTGCSICNPDKIYECLQCGEGFEAIRVNNEITCTKCPDDCKSCKNGVCQVCREGLRLMNNTCIAQCNLPCKQCSPTNGSVCTSCVGGFTFNGGSCTPILSCNTNSSCSFCPFGFNLARGKCTKCAGGKNCRVCDNIKSGTCASCDVSYYLNPAGTCQTCQIEGCVDCKDKKNCQKCKPGYVLQSSKYGKCLPCDNKCKTCYKVPTRCEVCAKGYTKQGWSCVNSKNVKISLKITAKLSTFTTAHYSSIQKKICQKVGKNKKSLTLTKLKSGSVILEASLDADNTAQQTEMMTDLQSLLAAGSSIEGFPIQEVSLTASTENNDTQTQLQQQPQQQTVNTAESGDATYYRNVAIVVGVVIPIGLSNYWLILVIMFAIGLILYKKGIIFPQDKYRKGNENQVDTAGSQKQLSDDKFV